MVQTFEKRHISANFNQLEEKYFMQSVLRIESCTLTWSLNEQARLKLFPGAH